MNAPALVLIPSRLCENPDPEYNHLAAFCSIRLSSAADQASKIYPKNLVVIKHPVLRFFRRISSSCVYRVSEASHLPPSRCDADNPSDPTQCLPARYSIPSAR